jgi:hypothetical protein
MGGGWGFSLTEGGKAAEDYETLLRAIFQTDLAQQEYDHSALC